MRILFANPAYRISIDKFNERYFFCAGSRCPWSLIKNKNAYPRYSMFPFFMGYAAALLEKSGFVVNVIDAAPLNLTTEEFINKARNAEPDIIVFEPATTSINFVIDISKILKDKTNAITVFTGSHSTVFAHDILKSNTHIDFILSGEYEFSLLNLIKYIKNNDVKIQEIDGIVYRSMEEIIKNEKTIFHDINDLPMPARHLFPSYDNNSLNLYHDGFCQNRPAIQLHSSRGCPFKCSFCLWTQVMYKQGLYRMFYPERVVEEMAHVIENHCAKEIYFDDDDFTADREHVLSICKKINDNNIKIPWSVMGDAMVTDEEMLYEMKKAGCIGIKFGVESTNNDILKNINKPLNIIKLQKLIKICAKLRIKTHISVSFGHIGETKLTIKRTLKDSVKINPDSIQFSLATAYPGTRFYNDVKNNNYLIALQWSDYDPTHNPIIKLPELPLDFLKRTEQKSHGWWLKRKLFNPGWIIRQLYFLFYLLKMQGLKGFIGRIFRAAAIIFSKKFK